MNLRSLMWGLGIQNVPCGWWRPPLKRFFERFTLDRVLSMNPLLNYVQEGAFAGRQRS